MRSLADAVVPVGEVSVLYGHGHTEGRYPITVGRGLMRFEQEHFEMAVGDTVWIPPGAFQRIQSIGNASLHLLYCGLPPYSHNDTEPGESGFMIQSIGVLSEPLFG